MDKTRLEGVLRQYNIRSVLNLRGASSSSWYENEEVTPNAFGAVHYDRKLSAKEFVPAPVLEEIIQLILSAPKPILVHCEGGADRTGLIVAAWQLMAQNAPVDVAARELSIWRGHFPYLAWSKSSAMDTSFADLSDRE